MAVEYPTIVNFVFEKMLASHGENNIIPNPIVDYFDNNTINAFPALNTNFEKYHWETTNFIVECGRKLNVLYLIVILYPFVYYMKVKYGDKHYLCSVWIKMESKYRF